MNRKMLLEVAWGGLLAGAAMGLLMFIAHRDSERARGRCLSYLAAVHTAHDTLLVKTLKPECHDFWSTSP